MERAGQTALELMQMVGALEEAADQDAAVATLVARIDALIATGPVVAVLKILETERRMAALAKTSIACRLDMRASHGPRLSQLSIES